MQETQNAKIGCLVMAAGNASRFGNNKASANGMSLNLTVIDRSSPRAKTSCRPERDDKSTIHTHILQIFLLNRLILNIIHDLDLNNK